LKLMASDESVASLATVSDPVALPVVVGVKLEVRVTLDAGLMVIGAVTPLTWYAVPLTAKLEMCTAALPVLLRTID
jgi:hypothetical protein